MSIGLDLKNGIKDALTGDSTYLGYLGTPTSQPYRTFWEESPEPPDLPYVVLRLMGGTADQGQDRPFEVGEDVLRVTIWTRDDTCESIADRVCYLLHQTTAAARSWRAVREGRPGDLRDTRTNAFGKVLRFRVHYNGATI